MEKCNACATPKDVYVSAQCQHNVSTMPSQCAVCWWGRWQSVSLHTLTHVICGGEEHAFVPLHAFVVLALQEARAWARIWNASTAIRCSHERYTETDGGRGGGVCFFVIYLCAITMKEKSELAYLTLPCHPTHRTRMEQHRPIVTGRMGCTFGTPNHMACDFI